MRPDLHYALLCNAVTFPEPLPRPHPLVRAAVLAGLLAVVALGTWGVLRVVGA